MFKFISLAGKFVSVAGLALGFISCGVFASQLVFAADLKVGDAAPLFHATTHEGKDFDLITRKGKWTVLYFYPKADTPGCTRQACSFRDSIQKVRDLGGEVYGISSDSPEEVAAFHKKHRLNFTLLSDSKLAAIESYGAKFPIVSRSKRWTYIIDPQLKIRDINRDVDPVKDAENVARKIKGFLEPPPLK